MACVADNMAIDISALDTALTADGIEFVQTIVPAIFAPIITLQLPASVALFAKQKATVCPADIEHTEAPLQFLILIGYDPLF